MIYDINGNGCVSVDETMNILYHRYGKAKMEVKIREIFGERKDSGLEGGEIGFARFLASFSKSQEETYWNTSQGMCNVLVSSILTCLVLCGYCVGIS